MRTMLDPAFEARVSPKGLGRSRRAVRHPRLPDHCWSRRCTGSAAQRLCRGPPWRDGRTTAAVAPRPAAGTPSDLRRSHRRIIGGAAVPRALRLLHRRGRLWRPQFVGAWCPHRLKNPDRRKTRCRLATRGLRKTASSRFSMQCQIPSLPPGSSPVGSCAISHSATSIFRIFTRAAKLLLFGMFVESIADTAYCNRSGGCENSNVHEPPD